MHSLSETPRRRRPGLVGFLSSAIHHGLRDLGATAPVTEPGTWDLAHDFSPTKNPGGTGWSYGHRDVGHIGDEAVVASAPLRLMDICARRSDVDLWSASGIGQPAIGKNNTELVQGLLEPGSLVMHPGTTAARQSEACVARWTACRPGPYRLEASFLGIDTRGLSVDVFVVIDGAVRFRDTLAGFGASVRFAADAVLTAGGIIDLIVANHGPTGDRNVIEVNATITAADSVQKD